MNRRHFLKAASLAGLSVFTPWGRLHSEEDFQPYQGPYWLMLNLPGGWDTSMFCDPKGREVRVRDNKPVNVWYGQNDIVNVQGLRVAPGEYYGEFLNRYIRHITVINGVDSETNGHKQGERVTWSGRLAPGYPSLGAVIAAERMQPYALPVPFLTFGGYEAAGELVAPTRLSDVELLLKVAAPNAARIDNGAQMTFHDDFAAQKAQALAEARLEAMRSNAQLPRVKGGMDALFTARLTEKNVERILDNLDIALVESLPYRGFDFVQRQGLLALTAFEAGICVSANLTIGGWDSHGGNDERQRMLYAALFNALDMIMGWAEDKGIREQLNIVVASDFGRTPFLNAGDGKDHWSVGSWMLIQGGDDSGPHVVGATDELIRAVPLDARGQVQDGDNGMVVTPGHIHRALRAKAGIGPDSAIGRQYPLVAEDIALFGG